MILDMSGVGGYAPNMRNCLAIAIAVLFAAVCAPNAHADSFTDGSLYFTLTSGNTAPTGSFVYDNTTSTMTSFTVDWDGAAFNFASLLTLAKLGSSGGWCAAGPSGIPPCGFSESFDLNGFIGYLEADTFTNISAAAGGGYSVIETAIPEPGSIDFILLALGGLAVARQRFPSVRRSYRRILGPATL